MWIEFKEKIEHCGKCNSTGKILGMGLLEKPCLNCLWKRFIVFMLEKIIDCFSGNPLKTSPVAITNFIFLLICIIFYHFKYYTIPQMWGVPIASFGSIFIALKYKLDQANYRKDLFEKRYAIFLIIDDLLSNINTYDKSNWGEVVSKLDAIYRKSYFLFGRKTYQFLQEFRQHACNKSKLSDNSNTECKDETKSKKIAAANEFFNRLIDGQKLPEKFPELKIDKY